ncbi:SulP family inorganic anion transporter [Tuberibacillus sp. Marseille-P3662]|uniref:SulP family inorganic anion transporter n=1 Tax=Tuberibacillus sp. Marseille-P3662 TaxID=1965358 RepID=UPI000A1CBF85|nr:SulP family inorganic anion transporter [Tuberibacillus sp. Marseille-P3662]
MDLKAFKGYSLQHFKRDLLSGIIVGIIAIPLGLGFAIASGTAPVTGIYTTIVAGLLIALLGGGRFQIGGPTGAFVPVLMGIISQFGYQNLLIAGFMAGILLMILAVCKVGSLIHFFPHSVITGFTAGIAVIIFTGQIVNFLGMHDIQQYQYFHLNMQAIAINLHLVNPYSIITALICLLTILVIPRFFPNAPAYLLGMLVSSTISAFFYNGRVETIGSIYGNIPSGFPEFQLPALTLDKIITLFPSAILIAVLAGLQSLLTSRVAADMTNFSHNNQKELIGQGVVNTVVPLFGGIPAAGEVARTVTNIRNGAHSPVAGMTHALVALSMLLLLAPYATHVAIASLAPVLMVVAWNISKRDQFIHVVKARTGDSWILLVTFVLTFSTNLTLGIGAGLFLSFCIYLYKKRQERRSSKTEEIRL